MQRQSDDPNAGSACTVSLVIRSVGRTRTRTSVAGPQSLSPRKKGASAGSGADRAWALSNAANSDHSGIRSAAPDQHHVTDADLGGVLRHPPPDVIQRGECSVDVIQLRVRLQEPCSAHRVAPDKCGRRLHRRLAAEGLPSPPPRKRAPWLRTTSCCEATARRRIGGSSP